MFNLKTDCEVSNETLKNLRNVKNEDLGLNLKLVQEAVKQSNSYSYDVDFFGNSTFNRVFKIKEYEYGLPAVIKFDIGLIENADQSLHLQQWANHLAVSEGVLTPKILLTDTSHTVCPFDFQIMEYIDGQTLYELRTDEKLVCKILEQVSEELQKLHSIRGSKFGLLSDQKKYWSWYILDQYDNNVIYLSDNKIIDTNTVDRMYKYTQDSEYRTLPYSSLLHGDLSYNNIIVKNGELAGIIDWEDALFGDPIFDLANLATFHPGNRHKYFIDSYHGKPDNFEKLFWSYYLRIAVSKTVSRHRFGIMENSELADARIDLALEKLKSYE